MFCKNCGTQMAEGQKFCPNCGAVIEQAAAPATPAAPVQPAAPVAPVQPAQPVEPVAPVAPVAPVQPEVQYGAPVPPMQPAPKKSKKGLIITLSIIGAVVIAAGVCVGIFWEDISDLFGGKKKSKSKDKDKDDESTSDFSDDEDFDYDYDDDDFEIDMEGYNSELNGYDVEVDLDDYLNDNDTTYYDEPDTTVSNNTTTDVDGKSVNAEEFLKTTQGKAIVNSLLPTMDNDTYIGSIYAQGNQIVYSYKYRQQLAMSASEVKESYDSSLSAHENTFKQEAAGWQEYIRMSGVSLKLQYLNADGTLLYERVYYQ